MSSLFIAILLIGIALLLLGIDLFVPTGGVLVVMSAIAAAAGIGFGFAHSVTVGGWFAIVVLAAIPAMLALFIKIYPRTPIGRRMIIPRPEPIAYDFGHRNDQSQHALVGSVGLAKTILHPSGLVAVDGLLIEAISSSGIIEAGESIRIIAYEMAVASVEAYLPPNEFKSHNVSSLDTISGTYVGSEKNDSQSLLNMPIEQFNLDEIQPEEGR